MGSFIEEGWLVMEGIFEKGIFEQETEGNKGGGHHTFCGYGTLLFFVREVADEG